MSHPRDRASRIRGSRAVAEASPVRSPETSIVIAAHYAFAIRRFHVRAFAQCWRHGARGFLIAIVSAHAIHTDENWLERLVSPLRPLDTAIVFGGQRGRPMSKFAEARDIERVFPDKPLRWTMTTSSSTISWPDSASWFRQPEPKNNRRVDVNERRQPHPREGIHLLIDAFSRIEHRRRVSTSWEARLAFPAAFFYLVYIHHGNMPG
ncbi:MAG TPA: hypothetical protein VF962_00105 [Gemmatimonadaceae bacterium]